MGSRCMDTGRRAHCVPWSLAWTDLSGKEKSVTVQDVSPGWIHSTLSQEPARNKIPGNLKLIILNFQYFESPRQKRRKVYCLARKRKVMESSATEATYMKSSVSFSLPPVWMMSLTSKDHDKECSNLTWNKVQTQIGERGRG